MRSEESQIAVEERLRNYLDNEAKLFADVPALSRFYEWQKQLLQPVKVESTNGIAGVKQLIGSAGKFELNHCYDNALQIAVASLDTLKINYVEGFVVLNERMLFGHAWNSIAGQYFDHTTELANAVCIEQGVPLPTRHFFKVIELPLREIYPRLYTDSDDEHMFQIRHYLKQNRLEPSALNIGGDDIIPKNVILP